jgi:hypothetical protein
LNSCKPSTSTVEHVTICTRCRDINVDAIHDHLALIKKQNDHIAQLSAKIDEHELENENFKFARSMLYSGRRPGIKDGIGFQQGDNVKLNALCNALNLGVDFFSFFFFSHTNSGVTLSFSLFFSLSLDLFQKL